MRQQAGKSNCRVSRCSRSLPSSVYGRAGVTGSSWAQNALRNASSACVRVYSSPIGKGLPHYEEVYLRAYRNGSEARRGIDAYLDLYNRERPHQSLGYRTPAQVFAEGRPLRCLPDQASTLLSREPTSDFPAGVSLNLASSLS